MCYKFLKVTDISKILIKSNEKKKCQITVCPENADIPEIEQYFNKSLEIKEKSSGDKHTDVYQYKVKRTAQFKPFFLRTKSYKDLKIMQTI